ncbi:MAG: hypothetical protein JXR91_11140 [Deltaproteobacteria bacterium]|nr:hypothetical protein [Deltaproteobacteria bacterium]
MVNSKETNENILEKIKLIISGLKKIKLQFGSSLKKDNNSEIINQTGDFSKKSKTGNEKIVKEITDIKQIDEKKKIAVKETSSIEINTELNMESDHNFFNGFSEDIIDGGIFIATFDPKPVGEKVVVRFKLPQNYPVVAKGVVQFVQLENPVEGVDTRTGMGVRFTHLMDSDKSAIQKYQKSRNPIFYDD